MVQTESIEKRIHNWAAMIHRIDITKEMIDKASERDHGAYNSMSFLKGKGNITGFLGEYMVQELCPHLIHVDTFDHDFEYNGKTIDVKTKNQNVPYEPRGHYEASVTIDSLNFQHPDYYIFCRIYNNEYGWVLGYISYNDLMSKGRHMEEGQDEGNMVFKKASINIRYDQLTHITRI